MALTLVTGPVRSGKSRFVVQIAQASGLRVTFVATALHDPTDAEWEARLARHRNDRPPQWSTVESAALDSAELTRLFANADQDECLVVDALGTWIAGRLACRIEAFERSAASVEAALEREAEALADAMLASRAQIVVVAEEVGWDVVPSAPSARMFRDILGRLKQRLARGAERTYLIVCGYSLDLSTLGVALD